MSIEQKYRVKRAPEPQEDSWLALGALVIAVLVIFGCIAWVTLKANNEWIDRHLDNQGLDQKVRLDLDEAGR